MKSTSRMKKILAAAGGVPRIPQLTLLVQTLPHRRISGGIYVDSQDHIRAGQPSRASTSHAKCRGGSHAIFSAQGVRTIISFARTATDRANLCQAFANLIDAATEVKNRGVERSQSVTSIPVVHRARPAKGRSAGYLVE